MSIGSWWLTQKQRFGHGPVTAWYRDRVRPRILDTAPITDTVDGRVELHVMTCAVDWLDLMWGLKSFYSASARRYRLCIHEDGSLSDDALGALSLHFPHARIILRRDADIEMEERLADYPFTAEFRRNNLLAPKVTDFVAYLDAERMLLFDSDLLFFSCPHGLLARLEDPNFTLNAFNADVQSAYVVSPELAREAFNIFLLPLVNSGLGVIQADCARYEWLEEFLAVESVRTGHFWHIEQTMYALCGSRYGAELLPSEYALSLDRGISDKPFRHYVGGIRHLLYREGIPALLRAKTIDLRS